MPEPIDAEFEVVHDPQAQPVEPAGAELHPATGLVSLVLSAAILIPLFMFVVTPFLRGVVNAWLGID